MPPTARPERSACNPPTDPSEKSRSSCCRALRGGEAVVCDKAERGLGTEEIAARLGLARSTVNKYRRDPDGERERARRESYRGRCRGCGRRTDGSRGPDRAPEWCPDCAPARRRRWSDEHMLDAIRGWALLTGAPPTVYDWSPAHAPAGHPGAARYLAEQGRWPSASSVAPNLERAARWCCDRQKRLQVRHRHVRPRASGRA